jgi:hypothetical protein
MKRVAGQSASRPSLTRTGVPSTRPTENLWRRWTRSGHREASHSRLPTGSSKARSRAISVIFPSPKAMSAVWSRPLAGSMTRPHRAKLAANWFAADSVEGDGFEPSVPRQKDNAFRDSSFPPCARATAAFENARRPVQQLLLPVVDPVRMNAELTRQLGDRPVRPTAATTTLRFNPRVVLLSVSASSPAPALSRFLGAGLHLSQPSHFRGPVQAIGAVTCF